MISINVDLPRNPTTMSISFSGTEACSCSDGSPSQLLRAIKQKLEDITLGGGILTAISQSEVNALEEDAFEVLRRIRTIKNSFAPISRIPPELLSVIPDYHCRDDRDGGDGEDGEGGKDQDLIAWTHVCRGWRNTFTSRSSLWTQLDFTNVDKTRTYIQRSQLSPLKLYFRDNNVIDDAFSLIIPHIHRLKSLTVNARWHAGVLKHFRCHTPLLEKFNIHITRGVEPILDYALFNGDLSSLRELRLHGVITDFPWGNLANLQVVNLRSYFHGYGTTQLLNFFESAPLLHTVTLEHWDQDSPDAPPKRIIPLRHLKDFAISTRSPHLALLHHLHIPAGASLISRFKFSGREIPLPDYLPDKCPNFDNLSHITTINLCFDRNNRFARLSGPSGSLRVLADCTGYRVSPSSILRSFGPPILSTVQRLSILGYRDSHPRSDCAILQTLSFMNHLRTLILIGCDDKPFIHTLDPKQRSSNPVLCVNIEELIIYTNSSNPPDIDSFTRMAKNRASRGVKLRSITLVNPYKLPLEGVTKLREHVAHVICRVSKHGPPAWDDVPGESCGGKIREVFCRSPWLTRRRALIDF